MVLINNCARVLRRTHGHKNATFSDKISKCWTFHLYCKIDESTGLVLLHLVHRICFVWSRRTCWGWRTLFSSSNSTAAWLWTNARICFQRLKHLCFYCSTGNLSGVICTRSGLLEAFPNWISILLYEYWARRRSLQRTMACIKLLSCLSKP